MVWTFFLLTGAWIRFFIDATSAPTELSTNLQETLEQSSSTGTQEYGEQANNSGKQTLPVQTTPPTTTINPIVVLLPPRFNKRQQQELSASIERLHGLQTTFFQAPDHRSYLKLLNAMTQGSRQADIILLPWSEKNSIDARSATLERNDSPAALLHPQVSPLLDDPSTSFIPYALDPRVTLQKKQADSITPDTVHLSTILQSLQQYKALPPLWGIHSRELLSKQQEPRAKRYQLLSIWFKQAILLGDETTIAPLLDDTQTVRQWSCFDRASCLLSDLIQVLWIPLSSLEPTDNWEQHFSVHSFPSLNTSQPTEVRWRVIRGDETNIQGRLQWIQDYLQLLSSDTLPYHERVLPVAQNRLSRLLLQPKWQHFSASIYQLDILDTSSKQLEEAFLSTKFVDVLEDKKPLARFLEEWNAYTQKK